MTDPDPTQNPGVQAPTACACGKPEDDPIHLDPFDVLGLERDAELPPGYEENHPFGWIGADPEVRAEMERLQEEYAAVQRLNGRKTRALAKGDPPMALDAASMMGMRFETILNVIMPPGTLDRLKFELFYEQTVNAALDDALSDQRRRSLGVTQPSGLHLPGRG